MEIRGTKALWPIYPGTELPYLLHIGMVLLALLPALEEEDGLNADLAVCCAMLHDVIEDTETAAEELKAAFGSSLTAGVLALSKNNKKMVSPGFAWGLTKFDFS